MTMPSYIEICERAAQAGGATLVEMLGKVSVWQKSPCDLVTEADLASQNVITEVIRQSFPDHAVLGEEDAAVAASAPTDAEYCWVIDPLDGTTNFAHNVPHFSVSVALLHREEPIAGVVFDPLRGELFSAVAGEGAQLNGKPIHASGVSQTSDALAAIGFPPGVDEKSADLRAFLHALPRFQAVRRTGSAALNLAYVAAGRFDATWSYSTRIWDMAAGVLLAQEAGSVVSSPEGGKVDFPTGHFLVAATESLHCDTALLLNG